MLDVEDNMEGGTAVGATTSYAMHTVQNQAAAAYGETVSSVEVAITNGLQPNEFSREFVLLDRIAWMGSYHMDTTDS